MRVLGFCIFFLIGFLSASSQTVYDLRFRIISAVKGVENYTNEISQAKPLVIFEKDKMGQPYLKLYLKSSNEGKLSLREKPLLYSDKNIYRFVWDCYSTSEKKKVSAFVTIYEYNHTYTGITHRILVMHPDEEMLTLNGVLQWPGTLLGYYNFKLD